LFAGGASGILLSRSSLIDPRPELAVNFVV
jgi:hypothetical protein